MHAVGTQRTFPSHILSSFLLCQWQEVNLEPSLTEDTTPTPPRAYVVAPANMPMMLETLFDGALLWLFSVAWRMNIETLCIARVFPLR